MAIEEMLTDIIHIYGFEHPVTIRFARYCEKYAYRTVEIAYTIIKEVYSPME